MHAETSMVSKFNKILIFASKTLYCFEATIEAATHSHLGISLKPLQLQLQLQLVKGNFRGLSGG